MLSNKMRRGSWLVCATASLTLVRAAHAAAGAENADNNAEEAAPASLQEVTVTAERRSESAVKTPVSLTVVSPEQLQGAGVTDTLQLPLVTPGLKFSAVGGTVSPFLRGVGTYATSAGNDPNIATYIDGIYQPQQSALAFDLPDVQQIQILKGPQGTLFGRNAMGGAVLVTTQQPSFSPSANASISYGNFNSVSLAAFGTGPLIDNKLAGSLSAYWNKNDGYNTNIVTGTDAGKLNSYGVRGKLRFTPTDDLTIGLVAYTSYREDSSLNFGSIANGNSTAKLIPGAIFATRPYDAATDDPVESYSKGYGVALNADYDFWLGDVSSTLSYSHARNQITLDADYSTAPLLYFTANYPDDNIAWENIFKSKAEQRLRWLLGTFVYYDRAGYDPGIAGSVYNNPANFESRSIQQDNAYAIFGSVDYDITSALTFTAGVRYGYELRRFDGAPGSIAAPPADSDLVRLGQKAWNSVTPRATLRYALDSKSNIYATFAEGFHSGVFDGFGLDPIPVNPEKLKAYEVGYKTDQGRWSLNVAGFYQRELDQQATAYAFNGLIYASILVNAGTADMYGADADFRFQINDLFNVQGAAEYLHAHYVKFANAILNVPNPVCPAGTYPCGNITEAGVNIAGYQLQQAPDVTANITGNYAQDFPFGRVTASLTASYSAKYFLELGDRVYQPSYVELNGQIGLRPAHLPLTISIWGRNLTDRQVIESSYVSNFGDPATYAPPRMYGVRLDYAF
jgi:iron complex outermembrane recepter protein